MRPLGQFVRRCLAPSMLVAFSVVAQAAEISIYSGGAVKAALAKVALDFESATAHRVNIDYAPVGTLMRRLADDTVPDIVLLTMDVMPTAEARGWAIHETLTAVGGIGVGVAVKEGTALPDISTPEALKNSLLAAKSITYIDPDKGTSGKHFAEVLRRLGIADAVKAKTTLGEAGYVVEPVARGEIEIGIQQITEILPVKGIRLVGPLPDSLQKTSVYVAARTPSARNPEIAQSFIAYLRSPEARRVFIDAGFAAP